MSIVHRGLSVGSQYNFCGTSVKHNFHEMSMKYNFHGTSVDYNFCGTSIKYNCKTSVVHMDFSIGSQYCSAVEKY